MFFKNKMKLLVAFICIVTINVVSSVVITKMSTLANKTFLSYETDQMLFSISNQTEKIRNEICSSVNEISSSLDRIFNLMKELKKDINEFQSMVNSTNCNNTNNNLTEVIPSKMKINKLLFVINNMNAIKADLYKINGIIANFQKVKCEEQNAKIQNLIKKYQNIQDTLNKLIELLQDYTKKDKSIPIDLLILN